MGAPNPKEPDPDGRWDFIVRKSAENEISKLSHPYDQEAVDIIHQVLAYDPFVGEQLTGYNNYYGYRFGDSRNPYRIVYSINARRRIFDVLRVRHRADAYQGLKQSSKR